MTNPPPEDPGPTPEDPGPTPPEEPGPETTPGWRTSRPTPTSGAPAAGPSTPPPHPGSPAPTPPPPAFPPPSSPPWSAPPPGGQPSTGPPPGGSSPPPQGPGGFGAPPGYGAPPPPPPTAKSKAPLFIALGVVALVVVVVIAIVGVSLLTDDSSGTTTTTEDPDLDRPRRDLRSALVDDDRDEVTEIVDDNPDLLDDATTAAVGDVTSVDLDREGLAFLTIDTTADEGFRVTATASGSPEIGGLVLDPSDEVVGAVGEVVEPTQDGEDVVLIFSRDGDRGGVDVSVGRVDSESLALADEVDGSIDAAGGVVEYEADLDEDTRYSVELDGADASVTVLDPDGTQLETSPSAQGLQFDAPTGGRYSIQVAGTGDATPSFTLTVTPIDDFTITNLTDGSVTSSGFGYTYNSAEEADTLFGRFRVEVREGVTIRVTSTPDATLDSGLTLVVGGTEEEAVNDAGPGEPESIEFTADQYSRLEFRSEALNSMPGMITITVERVG